MGVTTSVTSYKVGKYWWGAIHWVFKLSSLRIRIISYDKNLITSSTFGVRLLDVVSTPSETWRDGPISKPVFLNSATRSRPIAAMIPGTKSLQDCTADTAESQLSVTQANKTLWAHLKRYVLVKPTISGILLFTAFRAIDGFYFRRSCSTSPSDDKRAEPRTMSTCIFHTVNGPSPDYCEALTAENAHRWAG